MSKNFVNKIDKICGNLTKNFAAADIQNLLTTQADACLRGRARDKLLFSAF